MRLQAGTDIAAFSQAWIHAPALVSLVEAFGGTHPGPGVPTAEALARLDEFSQVWDYRRQKAERNEVVAPDFDLETRALVDAAARELGLQDTEPPPRSRYDHVVILGGLVRGCISRPLGAAALLRSGALSADSVIALSAFRPRNEAEDGIARLFDIDSVQMEFGFMDFGVRMAFELGEPHEVLGSESPDETMRWRVHRYRNDGGAPVQVVAAPAPEVGIRANTADTCRWLANHWHTFEAGESVLIVTTFHYRLFQLADAIREIGLPFGLTVDALGIDPGEADPRLAWQPTTQAYLQEIRSSIRALRQLLAVAG